MAHKHRGQRQGQSKQTLYDFMDDGINQWLLHFWQAIQCSNKEQWKIAIKFLEARMVEGCLALNNAFTHWYDMSMVSNDGSADGDYMVLLPHWHYRHIRWLTLTLELGKTKAMIITYVEYALFLCLLKHELIHVLKYNIGLNITKTNASNNYLIQVQW